MIKLEERGKPSDRHGHVKFLHQNFLTEKVKLKKWK